MGNWFECIVHQIICMKEKCMLEKCNVKPWETSTHLSECLKLEKDSLCGETVTLIQYLWGYEMVQLLAKQFGSFLKSVHHTTETFHS